jgi:hypothetical protein
MYLNRNILSGAFRRVENIFPLYFFLQKNLAHIYVEVFVFNQV